MKFENTKKDLTIAYAGNGERILIPGTGVTKEGEFRVGSVDVPDKELPNFMSDLSKLLHAGRVKVPAEDLEFLQSAGLLEPKQV